MGTPFPDQKQDASARYSLGRYALIILVFALPTAGIIAIGLELIYSNLAWLLYWSILIYFSLVFVFAGVAILTAIYRFRRHGKQPKPEPKGKMKPSWINTLNIYANYSLADIVFVVILVILTKNSSYPQPLSLFLLGIIIPVIILAGYIHRSAVLSLLSRDFFIPIGVEVTTIWVSSSLAKVLLNQRRVRGLAYLRNSLWLIRKVFVNGGRYSSSLGDAISLTNFAYKTGIQVNYERLLQFAKRIFPAYSPSRLDLVPDQCRYLVDDLDFDWFRETKEIRDSNRGGVIGIGQQASKVLKWAIGSVSVGTIIGFGSYLLSYLDQAIKNVSNPAPHGDLLAIGAAVLALAVLSSYYPALQLRQILTVWVYPGDLRDYSKGYDHIE